jgi:hypothetical protein
MARLYILLYFLNTEQVIAVESGPMTIVRCRSYIEQLHEIKKLYKADGIDLVCLYTGREVKA